MAVMVPDLSEFQLSQFKSNGEVQVYKALKDRLPDSFTVFSQVSWILKRENEDAKDGETDFIICHPGYGYLCLEVKGGGISFDPNTNQWFSIDSHQQKNIIKDPIYQAKSAKYSIRTKLYENEEWKKQNFSKVNCGHAVFFPDISDANPLERIDMPINLIGIKETLNNIKKWIEECFEYWGGDNKPISLGQNGINIIHEIFAKLVSVRPLVSSSLKMEEELRIQLTNEQIRILGILIKQRRVVVSGGAGTGKTILAVEKAKKLANEGFSTLLTCYNRPLADHLAKVCKDIKGLNVMSFHQLCDQKVKYANIMSGRNLLEEARITYPGEDEFDVLMPNALLFATEIIDDRYDAIVCDEGQDFREEYWLPLDSLLTDDKTSPFYIFYDDNQNLYSRVSTFPIQQPSYPLSLNCRNTKQIHNASYRHYKGDPVNPSSLSGQEVYFEVANTVNNQATKINTKIVQLITQEKVLPSSISVLIVDAIHKEEYCGALERLPLPKNTKFTDDELRTDESILITTVNRFKGLESEIIFLWGMNSIDISEYREHLYVGLSRAKSILFIVGNSEICLKLQES